MKDDVQILVSLRRQICLTSLPIILQAIAFNLQHLFLHQRYYNPNFEKWFVFPIISFHRQFFFFGSPLAPASFFAWCLNSVRRPKELTSFQHQVLYSLYRHSFCYCYYTIGCSSIRIRSCSRLLLVLAYVILPMSWFDINYPTLIISQHRGPRNQIYTNMLLTLDLSLYAEPTVWSL